MAGSVVATGGQQAPGGGKLTHVKLVTARSPLKHVTVRLTSACIGSEPATSSLSTACQVALEEEENVAELKRKLEQAVGVPASDMKIRLGGYNQFVMIDTTSNIRVGSCGVTKGAQRAGADAGTRTGTLRCAL